MVQTIQKVVRTFWIGDFGRKNTTYKHWTCTSMLLMTCEFQRYQYLKDCNLCSNNSAKKGDITIFCLANY